MGLPTLTVTGKLGVAGESNLVGIPRLAKLAAGGPPLPLPPACADYISRLSPVGMLGNDRYSDCVIAAILHVLASQTLYTTGEERLATDEMALAAYADVDPNFNPDDPNTDNGLVISDALKVWLTTGFSVGPNEVSKATAYCTVSPRNIPEIKTAIDLMGNVILGLQLPTAWRSLSYWGMGPNIRGPWEPNTWGAHCVPALFYNDSGVEVVTWGQKMFITWAGLSMYAFEAFSVLGPEWVDASGKAPNHSLWPQLVADMSSLKEMSA